MSAISIRKKNENLIWWEPVQASPRVPFTVIGEVFSRHEMSLQAFRSVQVSPSDTAPSVVNDSTAFATKHEAMLTTARMWSPDQSWYDEDFRGLRHPR